MPLAGNPQNGQQWTHLTPREVSIGLTTKGRSVSVYTARGLFKQFHLGRRSMRKDITLKQAQGRNEQFERIQALRKDYESELILSIDGKKKEYLGEFYRKGQVYGEKAIRAFDHDFNSEAKGLLCPYGVYDVGAKQGCILLGESRQTADFAVDSLKVYLERYVLNQGPAPQRLLLLCDGGGSNGSANRLFKYNLQQLADATGIHIRVAHYPPYCSKYNPIEHRFFSHITRCWQGVKLESIAQVRALTRLKAKFTLKVKIKVATLRKTYKTGKKVAQQVFNKLNIIHDQELGKWNYCIVPNSSP